MFKCLSFNDRPWGVSVPFFLQFIDDNATEIEDTGSKILFNNGEFKVGGLSVHSVFLFFLLFFLQIIVCGGGDQTSQNPGETFLWQLVNNYDSYTSYSTVEPLCPPRKGQPLQTVYNVDQFPLLFKDDLCAVDKMASPNVFLLQRFLLQLTHRQCLPCPWSQLPLSSPTVELQLRTLWLKEIISK